MSEQEILEKFICVIVGLGLEFSSSSGHECLSLCQKADTCFPVLIPR
jgi:hypothetical protein